MGAVAGAGERIGLCGLTDKENTIMTLDVLRMQRRLQDVGVPQEQAEVFAEEVAHILASQVATKADLQEFRSEMLGKFAEVDGKFAEMLGKFAEVDSKFAEMLGNFAEVDGKFVAVDGKFAEMLGKFAEVDSKFAEVNGKIAELTTRIAELRNEMAELRNELAEVRNEMASFKSGFAKWIVGLAVAILLGFAGISVAMVLSVFRLAAALG